MINAIEVACELNAMLPAAERPEHTEGYEGFYHCVGFDGTVERAEISYIIRDHDTAKFEQKKSYLWSAVDLLTKKYGDGVLTLTLKDQYFNMRKMVEPALVHGTAVPQSLHGRHEFPRQVRVLLAHDDAQGRAGDPEPGAAVGQIAPDDGSVRILENGGGHPFGAGGRLRL